MLLTDEEVEPSMKTKGLLILKTQEIKSSKHNTNNINVTVFILVQILIYIQLNSANTAFLVMYNSTLLN